MKKLPKNRSLLIIVILFVAIVVGYVAYSYSKPPDGMVILGGYEHIYDENGLGFGCQALIPQCGYCPGEIKNKNCYVTPEEAAKWDRR